MRRAIVIIIVMILLCECVSNSYETKPPTVEKEFDLSGGTFPADIHVIILKDERRSKELIELYTGQEIDTSLLQDSEGFTLCPQDNSSILIWLSKFSNTPEDIAVANHELLHATFLCMKHADVYLTDSSEEAFTYQFQYYSKQFFEKVKSYEQTN